MVAPASGRPTLLVAPASRRPTLNTGRTDGSAGLRPGHVGPPAADGSAGVRPAQAVDPGVPQAPASVKAFLRGAEVTAALDNRRAPPRARTRLSAWAASAVQ